jgi:hypothetical protein
MVVFDVAKGLLQSVPLPAQFPLRLQSSDNGFDVEIQWLLIIVPN